MSIHISPISHGNHNNVWFNVKSKYMTMKICGFYDTGDAYITKTCIKKEFDQNAVFERIKEKLNWQFDFNIKTPKNKAFKHNFVNTEQLLHYIRQIST